jgi:DNA-binding LacI/PurR family transcriptional regulator
MVTITDVAKRAGVSKSSVSRVLNNKYEYISEDLKQKILEAIKELNYRPNSLAQSLKKRETRVIGIVISDLSPFWAELLKGVQKECIKQGYGLMVSDSSMDPKREEDNIQMLLDKRVDGIIINTINPRSEIFLQLKELNIPFVFVNSMNELFESDCVLTNNHEGTKEAMEYLIKLGHQKIAIFLYPIENNLVRTERLEVYKKVLEDNQIPINETLINICNPGKGNGLHNTLQLLRTPDHPTAFLSTNINLTLEIMKGIKQSGMEIPTDISVVSFDDFEWTPLLDPPLTTIAYSSLEMGIQATNLLLKKLKRKRQKTPQKIEIIPEFIIRNSASVVKNL